MSRGWLRSGALCLLCFTAACLLSPVNYLGKTCQGPCPGGLVCACGICVADAAVCSADAGGCDADVNIDGKNCGWCGHDCRGLGCNGGVCNSQPVFQDSVASMAVESGTLYYAQYGGDVRAYDTVNGAGTTTFLAGAIAASAVMAKAPRVYWCDVDGAYRAYEDGGQVEALSVIYDMKGCQCTSASATDLYWWAQATQKAFRIPLGAPSDAGQAYFPLAGAPGDGCVAANSSWAAINEGVVTLHSLNSAAGASFDAPGALNPALLALLGGDVFFVSSSDAGLTSVNRANSGIPVPAPIRSWTGASASALVADSAGVYWAEPDGYVHGCSDAACTLGVRVWAKASGVTALALDDLWIYVATGGGSPQVVRSAR